MIPELTRRWNCRLGAEERYASCQRIGLSSLSFQCRCYVRMKWMKRLIDGVRVDGTLRWR